MKKILSVIAVLLVSMSASAQLWSDKDHFAVEVSVGSGHLLNTKLDAKSKMDCLGEVTARVQHDFENAITWDVLSASLTGWNLNEWSSLQIKTGVRLYSPQFYKQMKAYTNMDMGYARHIDHERNGFALEWGLGVHATKHIYFGYNFNMAKYKGHIKSKENYLKVGYKF